MKEQDLYPPLKRTLESLGYEVKGEVEGCDVVGMRKDSDGKDEPPLIVELKLQLNLKVILQAVDRFAISESVYVGIPAGMKTWTRERKGLLKLFRRLGLGLITIDPKIGGRKKSAPTGIVHIVLDPDPSRARPNKRRSARLKREFNTRIGDTIPGGQSTRSKQLTSYRQRAILIAKHLRAEGPTKASLIAAELSEPKARIIMYNNVYGWFDAEGRGIYRLSVVGEKELEEWA
jgi:hypothetical protein